MAKRGQAVRRSQTRSRVPTKPKRAPADIDLKKENAALGLELAEALERQTATAEVLQVINSSPGDLAPVFDAMLKNATRLCEASHGHVWRFDGRLLHSVAVRGDPWFTAWLQEHSPVPPIPGSAADRIAGGEDIVHVADRREEEAYTCDRVFRDLVDASGVRSSLSVALRRPGMLLGIINVYRQKVRPFSEKQIALLQNFAAQAVVAMENARLISETRLALERQTATAEVLQVINSSPGNLAPVFDAILEKAHRLCGVSYGSLQLYDGETFRAVAVHGLSSTFADQLRQGYVPGPNAPSRRLLEGARFAHVPDLGAIDDSVARAAAELSAIRTTLYIPLHKNGTLLGSIVAARQEVRPFTEKEIALLESFAGQAIIAMENARLLGALRERTADLARSVDELTATGDVLKIISRSSVELEMVLDTLVETVARLCRADQSAMFRRRDDKYHLVAARGFSAGGKEFVLTHPLTDDRGTLSGRVAAERRPVHIPDVLQDPEYTYEGQTIVGYRTMLGIPLLREQTLIGIFSITRTRVEPFTDKEIELASSFADQAVIAIENARLFEELHDRQAELRVTFDNMGDGVVMFDAEARLTAWNRNFQEMLDLPDDYLAGRPSYAEYFRYLADRGEYSTDLEAQLSRTIEDTSREMRFERTRPDGRVIEVRRNPVAGGGFVLIYSDITERKHAEEAIRTARDAAEVALRDLQTAQAGLVQAQKMAALGQLTAGIAHEIKNPLNFVNNFSALSVDLIDELEDVLKPAALDGKTREETSELTHILKGNLEKVVQHGKRADSIVRNMLLHYREGSGERRPVNLNALVDESLNLAYHGARAENQEFKVRLERSFDPATGEVDLFPQEMTRALLNMISNGFYAATKRKAKIGLNECEPTLTVTTKNVGNKVEITLRDNGSGIPPEVREKMFNPFFTTKPPGEGTGLGLSLSYDIVVKQHSGSIEVDTQPGEFTEFKVILPR
jgi:two-component system, NtrC family, sensor kinase